MRIILTFLAFLLLPHTAFALNLLHPAPGEANVKVDAYFQWQEVVIGYECRLSGACIALGETIVPWTNCGSCDTSLVCCKKSAPKYILDVDQFTQSEDNILPKVCSAGVCSFGFLELTAGHIGYADEYKWRVTALNSAENPISSSPEWTFTTEQAPAGPPPPGYGDGTTSQKLENPISAKNITELFNKIFSFLFGLAIFIVPVIVIYAAFLMLMGGGDPVKLAKGRMILLWTAVAFILILLSKGLPIVLKNLL